MSSQSSQDYTRNLCIILGSTLGSLLIGLIAAIVYTYSKDKRGYFWSRSVTPVTDAEIESWRRPTNPRQWQEKPQRVPARALSVRVSRREEIPWRWDVEAGWNRISSRPNDIYLDFQCPPEYQPYDDRRPSVPLRERPPTPYSPATPPNLVEVASPVTPPTYAHYHTPSQASDFDFGFERDFSSPGTISTADSTRFLTSSRRDTFSSC